VEEGERRGYEKTWLLGMLVLLPILEIGGFPWTGLKEGRSGSQVGYYRLYHLWGIVTGTVIAKARRNG
jgi:hypothetical protein